jgi:hypothetical protein
VSDLILYFAKLHFRFRDDEEINTAKKDRDVSDVLRSLFLAYVAIFL